MTLRFLVSLVFVSLLPAQALAQTADGILFTQRVTSGGPPLTVQVQIEATRMRTEVAGPNGAPQVTIFDGAKQVLYIVDPARKTYVEMTKADVDRLSTQLQGAMAQMQAQLDKLPPAQRAQMEAVLKGQVKAVALQPTGSDKVGRWTCNKYDLMQDARKIGEVCNVSPATLGFGVADFDVLRQMGAFYSTMGSLMPNQLPGVSGLDQRGSSDFPVKTVLMMGQGQAVTTEVIDARRQAFPDSLFAVPAGFTKQDMAGLMGGRGIGPGR